MKALICQVCSGVGRRKTPMPEVPYGYLWAPCENCQGQGTVGLYEKEAERGQERAIEGRDER